MSLHITPSSRIGRLSFFWLALPLFLLALGLTPADHAAAQSAVDFSKSFQPSTIGPGSTTALEFEITNNTSFAYRDVAFVDNLPAGVVIATPSGAESTCPGLLSAPDGGSTISLSGGGLAASGTCVLTVNVTSSTPGTHTNTTGPLTYGSGGSSQAAVADLIVSDGRPGFSKSFSPSSISPGQISTLTFTIDNSANQSSASNVGFTDVLPADLVVASPSNATTNCQFASFSAGPSGSGGGDQITMSGGLVAAGATCTASVDVTSAVAGVYVNTSFELTSSFVSSGFATAALEVAFQALTKLFTDDPAVPGGTVTLEFTFTNLDRRSSATNISFTDDLSFLTGLTSTDLPKDDVCGPGSTLSEAGNVLSLAVGNLGPGGSCTFSTVLQVPQGAAPDSYTNTTSAVTYDVAGEPITGNVASDVLVVATAPILTKTFTDDPVSAGDTVTLEFTILNTSSASSLTDIAFSDAVGAMFGGISVDSPTLPTSGFCGPSSSMFASLILDELTLNVTGASLDPGQSCTFSVVLNVPSDVTNGIYANVTSAITGLVGGQTPVEGSPASDDLTVVAAPVLQKVFIDDPVAPGSDVTLRFRLTLSENAPGDATEIAFSDDLDATLSGLVAAGLPLNACGGTLTGTSSLSFAGGTLVPGETCSFDVTLTVPETATSGTFGNTTSNITATVSGTAVSGRTASDDLQVVELTLAKAFIDDPVAPGGTVTLEFTIANGTASEQATDISFNDDLSDVLSGLVATGFPTNTCGGTITGTNFLSFSGGSLSAGTSCTISATLAVPGGASPNQYGNTTSAVQATIGGITVALPPASDFLVVADPTASITISKEFTDDPVLADETVTLEFSLGFAGPAPATGITFTDDLNAVIAGLQAVGLPASDVCGSGSSLAGTDVLSFSGGTLDPDATCTFSVTLQVPSTATEGSYANTTSDVSATVGVLNITGGPASDNLLIGPDRDEDDDGVLDGEDNCPGRYNPDQADNDQDGFGDVCDPDDDNDRIDDGVDNCPFDYNPGQEDTDGDGKGDACDPDSDGDGIDDDEDNCPLVENPGQENNDGDAFGDACDDDDDNDGVLDGDDNCPFEANPGQEDNDEDGIGDVCDPDDDNDGVLDGDDNCPFAENPGQEDNDEDGQGDVCDPDDDNDGVLDGDDNCPFDANPGQEDADGDGLGDVCDPDDDNDGVLDGDDFCADTVIPESVPTVELKQNHYALVDDDLTFDTFTKGKGGGPPEVFTTTETGGCSCEQIVEQLGLGDNHLRQGCSNSAMLEWTEFVAASSPGDVPTQGRKKGLLSRTGKGDIPDEYRVDGNYPNPFNPSTTILFATPEEAFVSLTVYDVMGREVMNLFDGTVEAGTHEVTFNAGSLPSGLYLYRLQTLGGTFVKTMLLLE